MDDDRKTYYRAVPGSRDLVTGAREGDGRLKVIEDDAGTGAQAPLHLWNGVWLGGARFQEGIAIPAEVFDLLAPLQTPIEQAVFFHLFRLAYGQGKNFCRVGKRELANRARLSDRRLNVALDGLVSKGHLKPVHRNTAGTLYRVFLPSEVLNIEGEPGLEQGEKLEPPGPAEKSPPAKRERPLESPINEESFVDLAPSSPRGPTIGEMAEWYYKQKGTKPNADKRQRAATVLTDLLEDGFSREEVMKALAWFVRNQPEEKTLDRLPYFVNQALEEPE